MMKPPSDAERNCEIGLLSVESLNCVLHDVDIFSLSTEKSFLCGMVRVHWLYRHPEWD